ncbi:MAG: hypothetical protein LUC88_10335 [Prevotella sp.]|nr:hypothetical protein [Prevotella sp.]
MLIVANKVYNFSSAFEVYNKFFNATNIDAVKALLNYRSYFGKEQYEVISAGFCGGAEKFKALSKGKSPLEFRSAYFLLKDWYDMRSGL